MYDRALYFTLFKVKKTTGDDCINMMLFEPSIDTRILNIIINQDIIYIYI